jgi:hypothetical protein
MVSSGMLRRVALVRTDLVFLRSVRRLLVTASAVRSSPILVTLMKEALSFSETSVLTIATRLNIPEDTILRCSRKFELSLCQSKKAVRSVSSVGCFQGRDWDSSVPVPQCLLLSHDVPVISQLNQCTLVYCSLLRRI